MRVVFTCGGTAGHINPAIALAERLRREDPEGEILFIGGKGGMEENLIPREGFSLRTIRISNFQRRLTPANILHNIAAAWQVFASRITARRMLKEFKPDVIVGMGGYASFPAMRAGAAMGIPVLVHEANAMPGLTTRMIANRADKVMVAFEESRQYYKHPERVVVTGMPVRSEFLNLDKEGMKEKLGLAGKRLVVSAWGSLGARDMNRMMEKFILLEAAEPEAPFVHIHATGKYAEEWMPRELSETGFEAEKHPDIRIVPYIYNMSELMVAADVILSRAGASSLNEIAASGTPSVIVPSPNVTANHQEKNARVLERRGGAAVLLEKDCTGELLYSTVKELMENPEQRKKMSSAVRECAVLDSADRILAMIREAAGGAVK